MFKNNGYDGCQMDLEQVKANIVNKMYNSSSCIKAFVLFQLYHPYVYDFNTINALIIIPVFFLLLCSVPFHILRNPISNPININTRSYATCSESLAFFSDEGQITNKFLTSFSDFSPFSILLI